MAETSASLLDLLRQSPDDAAWKRLVELYEPLMRRWLRQFPVLQNDADDIVQDVLSVLLRKLPAFDRQRTGSFRRWLRGITVNCLRDFWRAKDRQPASSDQALLEKLDLLEDPHSESSQMWDEEHQRHVAAYLLAHIRSRFEETTWRAFEQVVLEGKKTAEVAQELGVTVNAVFISKSRVLAALRKEGEGLLE